MVSDNWLQQVIMLLRHFFISLTHTAHSLFFSVFIIFSLLVFFFYPFLSPLLTALSVLFLLFSSSFPNHMVSSHTFSTEIITVPVTSQSLYTGTLFQLTLYWAHYTWSKVKKNRCYSLASVILTNFIPQCSWIHKSDWSQRCLLIFLGVHFFPYNSTVQKTVPDITWAVNIL